MLRRRVDGSVYETCHVDLGGRTIYLHGLDQTPDGFVRETAIEVERGLCVPDDMLAAPPGVKLDAA